MSFRCQKCGVPQPSGSSPTKVVVATREVEYRNSVKNFLGQRDYIQSRGTQIAREENRCSVCVEEATE